MNNKRDNKKGTRACRMCGGLFVFSGLGYGYCPRCEKIDNMNFKRVKNYLRDHGTATAEEISEATEVSVNAIMKYLRDGRVEIPENSPIFIQCEECGVDIRYGRYCPDCALKMKKDLKKGFASIEQFDVGEKPRVKIASTMYTYRRDQK